MVLEMEMDEIERTFKELGISTEENHINGYPTIINEVPENYQIRLDNVSKELD